jgi:hypothetical protein
VVLLEVPGAAAVGVAQAVHDPTARSSSVPARELREEDELDLDVVLGDHAGERRREPTLVVLEQVDDAPCSRAAATSDFARRRSSGAPGRVSSRSPRSSGVGSSARGRARRGAARRGRVRGRVTQVHDVRGRERVPGLEGQEPREQVRRLDEDDPSLRRRSRGGAQSMGQDGHGRCPRRLSHVADRRVDHTRARIDDAAFEMMRRSRRSATRGCDARWPSGPSRCAARSR